MPAHARTKPRRARIAAGKAGRVWRGWQRSRPFSGAAIAIAGGAEIMLVRFTLPVNNPRTIVPAGLLIAGGIIACGLLLLFDPVQRSVYATATILLAISALTTSHLGGYLVGALLGVAGGAVAFAWVPSRPTGDAAPSTLPGFTLIRGEADAMPERASEAAGRRRLDRIDRPG